MRELLASLVQLEVSPDQLSAALSLAPGIAPGELSESLILTLIGGWRGGGYAGSDLRVTPEVRANIRQAIQDYLNDPARTHTLAIAHGTPVIHGQDGELELDPAFIHSTRVAPSDTEQLPQLAVMDADASVNNAVTRDPSEQTDHYRSVINLVPCGAILGRICPPVFGTDGLSVFGRVIAARHARALILDVDESVRVHPDGRIEAIWAGVLDVDLPRLRVLRQLEIPGNVDFTTGNLDFAGDVVIARAIKDGFAVTASGSVRVYGLAEAATLCSGLDTELIGGMAAREKGSVRAGRDLKARYLDNVRASVGRDLCFDRELINCRLGVGRNVCAPSGSITGGMLTVAGSVDVAQLGNPSETPTRLALGRMGALASLLDEARPMLESLYHRKARLEQRLSQLQSAALRPSPVHAEELTEMTFTLAAIQARSAHLCRQIDQTCAAIQRHTRVELIVHRQLCAGVLLYIGNRVCEAFRDIDGPIRIFCPISAGESSLPTDAEPMCMDLTTRREFPLRELLRVHTHDSFQGPALSEPITRAA